MSTRTRKETKRYARHRKIPKSGCEFCNFNSESTGFIKETEHFVVIENAFKYTLWDSLTVTEHLMVVPKKHIDTLSDISDKEAVEFFRLISEYEDQGFNVYARTPVSKMKSVVHQHTHLIKTTGRPKSFILALRKPYFLLTR